MDKRGAAPPRQLSGSGPSLAAPGTTCNSAPKHLRRGACSASLPLCKMKATPAQFQRRKCLEACSSNKTVKSIFRYLPSIDMTKIEIPIILSLRVNTRSLEIVNKAAISFVYILPQQRRHPKRSEGS